MIKTLSSTPILEIHDAFVDAFSEYEVRIDMPLEKLQEMLTTRSCALDRSLGYFEQDRLVGFVLVGCRDIDAQTYYYDVATGVRQSHQSKGVGDKLVRELMEQMNSQGVHGFYLEVLENNVGAQKLYKKYGFEVTRKLRCYELEKSRLSAVGSTEPAASQGFLVQPVEGVQSEPGSAGPAAGQSAWARWLLELPAEYYCSFRPSWQNALASYLQNTSQHAVCLATLAGQPVGYGVVHKVNGSVLQIGLEPMHQEVKKLELLVAQLASLTEASTLRYLNVEDGCELQPLLEQVGFQNSVNQFEMLYVVP